ncbi:MAG TPA: TetR/AcrR family transcriptional regulator [Pseudonocardiaceae bacterium]|nr:TetR/AcrR family transcriptional regulator [Pseudonocardiaceae bacterium]
MGDRRQEILDAALAIADEKGLPSVTMRAVAERVGVTPMALYPHVGDKDGLLDGMLGRLLGRLRIADDGDWRQRLAVLARAMRALAREHPGATSLLFARPTVSPDAVRVVDAIYSALLEAGVPPADVPRIERLASTLILGFAVSEASGRFGTGTLNQRARRGQLPDCDLPGHHALAETLDAEVDWSAEFEADLADITTLIESYARR